MTVYVDMSPLDTPSRLRGIGQYILGLASGFRDLKAAGDLEPDVGGLAQFDWKGKITRSEGLDYLGSPIHPDEYHEGRYRMRKRLGLGRAACAVGAQLLHVTEPVALPLTLKVPIILTCYDLIPLVLHQQYLGPIPGTRAVRRWQESRMYGSARRIVAISHATKADLVEHLGIDETVIDVAHLGVDHQRFVPEATSQDERARVCSRHGLAKPFLFYLGAFDSRKNIPLLIRAFANAGLTHEFDLVLAGALRARKRLELESLAHQLGVGSSVRLIGFVEDSDIAPLYRACHLHAFPSKYEGFGLTVAEAMACGAPTVAVRATSVPEVAGDAAELVPPDNLEALTECLRSLCRDDAKRRRLSELGPPAASRFKWRECARMTLESYKKALR